MGRPTIQDVADRAGVSKATVSAVLNDKGTMKASTREGVLDAIRALNYRPNPAARRRVTSRGSRSVGFVLREIANPYYAEIIAGAEEYLREHDCIMLVGASEGDFAAEQRVINLLTLKDVDGLLLTPVRDDKTDLAHIFDLKRRNVSFVLLEAIHGVQANLVDVDSVDGAKRAARHLIELGHTRIVHFGGPEYSLHSQERISGVRAAYSESRLIFSDELVVQAGDSLADGYRAGLAYFRDRAPAERATGLTCYNDLVALGVCRALSELGLRIPDDVSVVGYDDLQLLEYVSPPLTSVRVPKREVGRLAAEILYREIDGGSRTPQKVYLQAELVVRGSTAPPPAEIDQSTPARARAG
ncbi:MAG TPA: LacI family DNA-binding transcriptional regulator [Longimicrobiaceae bacterium]|nr:LacI family DNA-binding transcriptional regulator [Longimicrobiaceae bacterium]